MRTRTIISVIPYGAMGAFAVALIVAIQRIALGLDLFDTPGFIIPTILGGAAGAFVRYSFLKTARGADRLGSDREPTAPVVPVQEVPDDLSFPAREVAEAPVQEAPEGLTDHGTGPEAAADAQTDGRGHGSVPGVEEPETAPVDRDMVEEESLSESAMPGELPAHAEPLEVEQLFPEQEAISQAQTAEPGDRTAEQKRTEGLPQNETDFPARFMEHADIFFAALDADGKVLMMNPALLGSLGYTLAEVMDTDFVSDFIPERLREEGWDDLFNPAAKPGPMTRECPVSSRDGREIPVEWHGTPAWDATGSLAYYCLVGIDITTRKQAEQAIRDRESHYRDVCEQSRTGLEYYRSVLDSFPDAMVIYDTEGRVTYTNPAFDEAFGWSLDELREEESQFIPASEREIESSMIEGLIRDGIPCTDFDAKRSCKRGRQVSAKLTAWPFHGRQGEVAGVLVFLRDITTEKEVERELERPTQERARRQIKAKDVMQDIRAGATDSELMEKHKLTAKGLQSVFQKLLQATIVKPSEIYGRLASYDETVAIEMSRIPVTEPPEPRKKSIKSSKITADIRAGITDSQMMEKYGLTAADLDHVFKQLVAAGVISAGEIERQSRLDTQDQDQQQQDGEPVKRELPRNYMVVSVPIFEAKNLLNEGTIIDVSEKGLKIQGIRTMEGEKKGLLVQGDEFHDVYPFVFDAVCRWTQTDGSTGDTVAGYQITAITDQSLEELRKLIAALSIGA